MVRGGKRLKYTLDWVGPVQVRVGWDEIIVLAIGVGWCEPDKSSMATGGESGRQQLRM
jgi:hypothetical protein